MASNPQHTEPWYESTAFLGALALLVTALVQVADAVAKGEAIDWPVWLEGTLGLVLGVVRTLKGQSPSSPSPRLTLRRKKGKGKAVAVVLALALLAPGCAGGLTAARAHAIVETAELVAHGVDVWCRPEVVDVSPEACEKARMWAEAGAAIAGIIIPGLVPMGPAVGTPKVAKTLTRAVPLTCDQAHALFCTAASPVADTAGCKAAQEGCRRMTGAVLAIPLLRR